MPACRRCKAFDQERISLSSALERLQNAAQPILMSLIASRENGKPVRIDSYLTDELAEARDQAIDILKWGEILHRKQG